MENKAKRTIREDLHDIDLELEKGEITLSDLERIQHHLYLLLLIAEHIKEEEEKSTFIANIQSMRAKVSHNVFKGTQAIAKLLESEFK